MLKYFEEFFMRILHTADWHLGKVFYGYSLIEDQKFVLNQIFEELKKAEDEKNPYSALVISGDIYDRSIPPVEATELLNDFLTKTSENFLTLHIFIISGNHDGATRLSFASSFLAKHNIHITTDTKHFLEPMIIKDLQSEQKVAFYQLPFLHSGEISASSAEMTEPKSAEMTISSEANEKKSEKNEEILRSQEELFSAACEQIINHHKKNYENMPSVLNAHLFTLGSNVEASERSCIGTAEQVNSSIFKDFTYGAFGHIHKFQVCDKNHHCYYSGSLLPYHFDDDEKSGFLDVEIKNAQEIPVVKRVLFKPLHKIAKLEGKFEDFITSGKNDEIVANHKADFLQITLTDEVEPKEPFARLKSIFPNLLMLSLKNRQNANSSFSMENRKKAIKSNDFGQIFSQFLNDVYGEREESEIIKKEKQIFEEEAKKIDAKEEE